MSMTTDLLATLGRKPLYKALETWLALNIVTLDTMVNNELDSVDASQRETLTDFQNIVHALYNIVDNELSQMPPDELEKAVVLEQNDEPEAHSPEVESNPYTWADYPDDSPLKKTIRHSKRED